ncbi:LacI family DNA-binding transcriptional regulator [Streptomyces sp. NPDC050433]|uniref:LacI family DNA-binding transcriptional regulator n=1 Tax=Streptomyces sp. NPDC050433 TaxID=3365615 RepID=UPI00379FDC01
MRAQVARTSDPTMGADVTGGRPTRRVTAADVAEALGVSRATVGYVLNNTPGQTISAQTKKRVLAEAERQGYRPHRAAQTLARGRTMVILLVLPDWPVGPVVLRNLDRSGQALDAAGYSLVTYVRHDGSRARPLWESLIPDAVVSWTPLTPEERASMRAAGITRILPGHEKERAALDSPSATAGARLQVEYLHALGHTRLAFAMPTDPRLAPLSMGRAAAAGQAAKKLGLELVDTKAVDCRSGSAVGAVKDWRRAGVTGVVAFHDEIAVTIAAAAQRSGLSVPGDLSVIGHDDNPVTEMVHPTLSSVQIDIVGLSRYFSELGRCLAEDRPLPEMMPDIHHTVVARESTAPLGRG